MPTVATRRQRVATAAKAAAVLEQPAKTGKRKKGQKGRFSWREVKLKNGDTLRTFDGFERYEMTRDGMVAVIAAALVKQGWKPDEFAFWAGVHPNTVRAILNNERRFPRLDTLFRMAEGLGVKLVAQNAKG